MPTAKLGAAVALVAIVAITTSWSVQARDARCRIFHQGSLALDRICDFQPDGRNGSFILSGRGGRGSLLPGISTVSVSVFEPVQAEVRGLTRDGINSRWGEARRSGNDRACWRGSDFSICVY